MGLSSLAFASSDVIERLSDKRTHQLDTIPLLSRNPSFVLRAANHLGNRKGDITRLPKVLRDPRNSSVPTQS